MSESTGNRSETDLWDRRSQIDTADATGVGEARERGMLPELSGTRIGRYSVGKTIGSGTGGVVFSAYDTRLKRYVALKLLHATRQSEKAEQERFVQEAQALARLEHPNVVAVYEIGSRPQGIFLAMEYVEGASLDIWLKQEPRSIRQILTVFIQAGEGLLAAHDKDIVHRDFKPANVLVTAKGKAKVIDFGLAQLPANEPADRVAAAPARRSKRVGTPAYMAPEQFEGATISPQTDQFSFCVALWESLIGQRPFAGDSLSETERRVCSGDFHALPPDHRVPAWILPILRRGLSVAPSDRWPSMAELLAALRNDPTRRRRLLGLAALGSGLTAASIGLWQLQVAADERATRAACEDSGAAIDALWNEEVGARVHKALVATGIPYAPTTFEKVLPWVTGFADAWKRTYTASCVETRLEKTRSHQSFAGVSECLEMQKLEFASFMKGLEDAGPTSVNKAVDAAAGLPRPTTCTDDKYLAIMPRLPTDPDLRARAKDIATRQADASMYSWLAEYDRGIELSRSALSDAESLGNAYQIANGHYQVATFLRMKGDFKGAVAEHTQSFLLAAGQGSDELAARNAIQNGFILASSLDLLDEANLWNSIAAMELKRGDGEDGLLAANLKLNLGALQYQKAEHQEARVAFQEAYDIRVKILGPNHPDVAGALNNMALNLYQLNDLAGAEQALQRAYDINVTAQGNDHPDTTITLSNLASIQGQRGDWAKARHSFTLAHDSFIRVYGAEHPFVATAKNNLATAMAELNDYQAALDLQYEALKIVEKNLGAKHSESALLLNNIGINHMYLAEYDEARKAFARAIEIREVTLPPDHPDLAVTITSLAALELGQNNLEEGVKLHRRALQIRQRKYPKEDDPSLAYNYLGLGDYHLKKGEPDEAIPLYRRSLELRIKGLEPTSAELAYSLTSLGEGLIYIAEYDEAIKHLEAALEIRTAAKVGPGLLARTQFYLGQALWAQGADRERGREFIEAARAGFEAAPPSFAKFRNDVKTWLDEHPNSTAG